MKKILLITILIMTLLLSACVDQSQLNALNRQIKTMTQKVEDLLDEVDDLKALESDFEKRIEEATKEVKDLAEENDTLNALLNAQNPEGLTQTASCVMGLIKDQDYQGLSDYVHPTLGIRFTPYQYVNVGSDIVLSATDVANLSSNTILYTWGSYDGSGDPITMTFADYYNAFVYDHDFQTPHLIAINNFVSSGNMINNITTVYPSADTVEFHFTGFDAQYDGIDWSSLILVFEEVSGDYYLVGIVHGQWTI